MAPERLLKIWSFCDGVPSFSSSSSSLIGSIIDGSDFGATTSAAVTLVVSLMVSTGTLVGSTGTQVGSTGTLVGSTGTLVVSTGGQYGTFSHHVSPPLLYLITYKFVMMSL